MRTCGKFVTFIHIICTEGGFIKVLVITTTFPRWSGDPRPAFVYELSKRLQKNNLDIVVLAPHQKGAETFEVMNNMKIYRFPYFYPKKFQTVAYGGGVLYNLKNSYLAKIQLPFFCFSELYFAVKLIKKEKIDLVHSHWLLPNGFIGSVCTKIYGIPHIASVHGSDINTIKNYKILKSMSSFIFQNSFIVTTNSNYTKKMIESIDLTFSKSVKVLPMGVDLDRFKRSIVRESSNNENSEFRVVCVGRLIDWKGIQYLIMAIKQVKSKIPNIKLFVVGEGPEKENLIKLADSMDLKDNVIFTGYVTELELPRYYHLADVFVLPSITLNGQTEALGVVTLEAMASRTPVIATNVGGVSDIVIDGYNGFLVPEKSPQDISAKILELFSNKEIATKFRLNGLKTINEKFSWDSISKDFCNLFYSSF